MEVKVIRELLEKVKNKEVSINEAMDKLKTLPFEDIDFAKLDHHRSLRMDHSEIIYCASKTKEQVLEIVKIMSQKKLNIMGTKANADTVKSLKQEFPEIKYNEKAKIFILENSKIEKNGSKILILTGGTSDIPVAEEAKETAAFLGNNVETVYDVGVAGIHRLFSVIDKILAANVIIAIAGMEGALASVVAGLVDKPVIAVPTSVGYGAAFEGLAALLSMINSCAPGVSVVNIDNGFGAGMLAARINKVHG
ncbi:MAG: nickel pincer cofactor biosynthesis protein LarB [Candidatus Margulisbacteria bacterium]|nr:nickel pincer cofactor biosynthesis protein LarB [Candidatus Margulisiibacteriota bacterium]